MGIEATADGALPDPLKRLTEELQKEMQRVLASGDEYEQGVVRGLSIALDLVAREEQRLRESHDEHVPGRVYGPR